MSRDSWILLVPMLAVLLTLSALVVESRQHHPDSTEMVHRHRHRHEPSSRWHHNYPPRRSSWDEDEDYEEREDESDQDYDLDLYERNYPSKKTHRGRVDSRHSGPYYHDNRHLTKYSERHRNFRSRGARERNPRIRPSRDSTYRKGGRSWKYDDEEDTDYYEDADKFNRYDENKDDLDTSDEYYAARRNHRKYRDDDYEKESEYRGHRDWKTRNSNSIRKDERKDRRRKVDTSYRSISKKRFHEDSPEDDVNNDSRGILSKKIFNDNATESYDYPENLDDLLDEESDDNEEDNSKEEKIRNVESDELDNDFYKNDAKPPLKTYDDIIRRLTSGDPTTPKPTRRDYRNTEIEKHLKRDAFGNLKYELKNVSRSEPELSVVTMRPFGLTTTENIINEEKSNSSKIGFSENRKILESGKKVIPEVVAVQVQTKSLEQEYEYMDNEQEDDPSAQADGSIVDYGEEENEDEDENSTLPKKTTTLTTTPTTTSTTTTTTTTQKSVDLRFYRKDLKTYEGSTGAQYNGYQSKNDYPSMSAHSIHKWQSLGTRESIKETRDKYPEFKNNGKSAEVNEAIQHALKVSREGSCQWPRARVVPVRDVYPSSSTTYVPHCAILHRCSDDTGCCRSEALTCVPKHTHRVELYFYTKNFEGSNVVEKLTFYNHTECECRQRNEFDTKIEKSSESRVTRQHPPLPSPQNLRRPQQRKPCRCPSEFTPRINPEGECQCKCSENDQNCIRTRRGKVYFSLRDRLCIQNGECSTPMCEFGEYMRRQGKCPRKQDLPDTSSNYYTNLHHGFRS